MSGPFAPGDVVVCVDDAIRPNTVFNTKLPIRGKMYRVVAVNKTANGRFYRVQVSGEFRIALGSRVPTGFEPMGFMPDRFRHLPKSDDAFTAQMRACRPLSHPEPAPRKEDA